MGFEPTNCGTIALRDGFEPMISVYFALMKIIAVTKLTNLLRIIFAVIPLGYMRPPDAGLHPIACNC